MASMRIALTKGQSALVDAEDYPALACFNWCASFSRGKWYAKRAERGPDGRQYTIRMHRAILGVPPGTEVDHINGDGLDNRRENLRPATRAENIRNTKRRSRNTSGFKGVYRLEGRWAASVARKYLGLYDSPEEAARAYDTQARMAFGPFAALNFPAETVTVAARRGVVPRNSTSGYRGVSYRRNSHKWVARLTVNGRRLFLGYFDNAEAASRAYDTKRQELLGQFASQSNA